MNILQIIICIVIGYLCGSFLTAAVVSKIRTGRDISLIGTGNPGMANVMSNIGKKEGVIVLAGDVLKVVAACLLAWLITWDMPLKQIILWTGFSAVIGHDFPVWRRFRGGKGVTVTCVWLVFFMPIAGSICCILGGIITILSGYLPLGAILIPILAIIPAFIWEGIVPGILVMISAALMLQRHWKGLNGIREGTEKKRFQKKSHSAGSSR